MKSLNRSKTLNLPFHMYWWEKMMCCTTCAFDALWFRLY